MMTTKALIAAAAFAVLPTIAFSMCLGPGHEQSATTCADGMVYDAESGDCVKVTG